jgi:hypothetical protein
MASAKAILRDTRFSVSLSDDLVGHVWQANEVRVNTSLTREATQG